MASVESVGRAIDNFLGREVADELVPGDPSPRAVPHEPDEPVARPCEEDCLSTEKGRGARAAALLVLRGRVAGFDAYRLYGARG